MEDEKSRLMMAKTTSAVASQQTIFRSRTAPHTQAQDTDGIDPFFSFFSFWLLCLFSLSLLSLLCLGSE